MNIDELSPALLVAGYAKRTKKRFGQHFLTDPSILDRIVSHAGVADGDAVLEIGPGPGTLTIQLIKAGARVTAVEIDDDAAAYLERQFGENLSLHHGDVLSMDVGEVLSAGVLSLIHI